MMLIKIAAGIIELTCIVCTAILASLEPGLGRVGVAAWAGAGPLLGLAFGSVNRLREPQTDILRWVIACSAAVLLLRLFATGGGMI
jgi:hypothetical protein